MDFVGSDPNMDSSVSGHSNSPDIDFNVQLVEDTTAYSQDFPNLSPPSQGPSSYWGQSDSDSQGSSTLLVSNSEINIEEQLLINTPDSLYNVYMANILPVTISTQQQWRMLCPDYHEWVQTSIFYFGFNLVMLSHLHLLLVASALEFLSSGQRTSAPSLCSFLGSAIMMVQMPYLSSWTLETPVLFGSSLNAAYHMDIARTYTEQIKQLKLQIINVALCNGASVHQVVNKLEDALEAMMRATWILLCSSVHIGPIWSLATDGDATQHAAGHKLFIKTLLPQDSPLFGTLINMLGLNLFTGDNEVMLDFDFKHIFKRICTLLRSPAGIVLNNGRIINSMMLARYLMWLPAYDEAAVTKLLHPDDPQDDPHAVELILAIIEFSKLQHAIIDDSFSTDIETRADLQSITLLSALLESIILPFTDISLSLSKQTMTKNSMFCIAKQQDLDSHAPFFLGDVGDDPLEILFGCTWMIGGHNSASSYAQALDHLGTAKDIDSHWHLKLTHQEGIDHINCEVWKGDIISGRCDLPLAWCNGHDAALAILATSQLDSVHYSFAEYFSMPGIDMLHLFGDNKYLGISLDELQDASNVPELPPPIAVIPPLQCLEMVLSQEDGDEVHDANAELEGEEDDDEELMLNFQEALIDESTDAAPSTQSSSNFSMNPLSPPLPQGPGFTKVNKPINMSVGQITDHNLFLVGDIFLTILRSSHTLSIGVLCSTAVTLNALLMGWWICHCPLSDSRDLQLDRSMVAKAPGKSLVMRSKQHVIYCGQKRLN
ncbi:hypothetical protein BD769DRAFT_1389819 [Suillus cothurnatus]|nr:hypothetical protein BD769DRAFT_1389819 [Suillus cothurnatus]